MQIVLPLALAVLTALAGASGARAADLEPARQAADAPKTDAAKPATKPAPLIADPSRDIGKAPLRSRVIKIDDPQFVRPGRQVRRGRVKRRRHSAWRRVWVYNAHERHGERHYRLVWRKFGGYFGPRGRIGDTPGLRRGRWCNCTAGRSYRHWHW